MTIENIQVNTLRYNAAECTFEAISMIYADDTCYRYPVSLPAGLQAEEALVLRALREKARKMHADRGKFLHSQCALQADGDVPPLAMSA